jgi:hypothetical protein
VDSFVGLNQERVGSVASGSGKILGEEIAEAIPMYSIHQIGAPMATTVITLRYHISCLLLGPDQPVV